MPALIAILAITGVSALLFLWMSLTGRFSDKMQEIARVDPQRARQISTMVLVVCLGLGHVVRLLDRWGEAEGAHSRTLDHKVTLIHSVQPVYPPLARQARVEGKVRLAATVGPSGHVRELKLLDGNPMLVDAAMEAVERWEYSPAISGGRPVDAKTEIDMDVRLDSPAPR